MNFDFGDLINPSIEKSDFQNAIYIAETELRKIPYTPFHTVLGQSLLHHTKDLAKWVDEYYRQVSVKMEVKSLYLEINEFDLNTHLWFIDAFAYAADGGIEDLDWLSQPATDISASSPFVLTGYEKLQDAFEHIDTDTAALHDARDWCEQIVITRFMELVWNVHRYAREQEMEWAAIPIYCTEHAYDFLFRSASYISSPSS